MATKTAYTNVSFEQVETHKMCPICDKPLTQPMIANTIISPTPTCSECSEVADDEILAISIKTKKQGTVFWLRDIWSTTDAEPIPMFDFYSEACNNWNN